MSLNADQDGSPGGSVTLTAGVLATGYTLIISSSIDELQETDITNAGGFYPEVITNALDLLTILVQQLQEQVNRSIKLPTTDPALQVELASAAQRAGLLLGFDSIGNAQAVVNVSTILPNYGIKVVPYSATPALNANQGSKLQITLTGNAAPTFTSGGGSSAVFFSVQVIQDAVGGRTFTWPANMKNMGTVNPAPKSVSEQLCSLDASGTARGPRANDVLLGETMRKWIAVLALLFVAPVVSAQSLQGSTNIAGSLNNVCIAAFQPGADAGAKITTCEATLPAGGGIVDARGLTGNQTLSSLAVTKGAVIWLGCGVYDVTSPINMANLGFLSGASIVGCKRTSEGSPKTVGTTLLGDTGAGSPDSAFAKYWPPAQNIAHRLSCPRCSHRTLQPV